MTIWVDSTKLTPTDKRLFERLADGEVHHPDSLNDCMWDDMGGNGRIKKAICLLRKKLPSHLMILYVIGQNRSNGSGYRLVRHINKGE